MMDDGGAAHEPIGVTLEHNPPAWLAVPCEVTRLRAENDCLRSEIGGLRLRLESLEMSYRAALADKAAKPAPRVVAPLHRAIAVRPDAYGLRVGMEF